MPVFQKRGRSSRLLAFATLTLTAQACLGAGSWYVSQSGNDTANCLTPTTACKTLSKAASLATVPGSISVAAGNYYESSPIVLGLGVAIIGAGMDQTVIHPTAAFPSGSAMIRLYGSPSMPAGNQIITRLTIDGAVNGQRKLQMGIDVYNVSYVTLDKVHIANCVSTGASLASSAASATMTDSQRITNIKVVDSAFENNANSPVGQNWANGNIQVYGASLLTLARNSIDSATTGGFGIKGAYNNNVLIFNNTIKTSLKNPINGAPDAGIEMQYGSTGEVFNNSTTGWISVPVWSNLNVHHNIVSISTVGTTDKQGFGVEINGANNLVTQNYLNNMLGVLMQGPSSNTTISQNVIANTLGGVFLSTDNSSASISNVNIYNNTIDNAQSLYGNGPISARIEGATGQISGVNIVNNIVSNIGPDAQNIPSITLTGQDGGATFVSNSTTNFVNVSVKSNLTKNSAGANGSTVALLDLRQKPTTAQSNVNADPQYTSSFNSSTMAPYARYQLSSSSPAIRTGSVITGMPYLGTAPDIGAFVQPPGANIEAEMNFSVKRTTTDTPSLSTATKASSGKAIALNGSGNAVRVHFYVAKDGNYALSARLRLGTASDSQAYANGYAFVVDGQLVTLGMTADTTSSTYDTSNGGIYWGTWKPSLPVTPLTLKAGLHSLDIQSTRSGGYVDYINVQ